MAEAQQQLSACCISGHLHEGNPKGSTTKLGDLDCYVSAPKDGSKKKSLVFITDIFGWDVPNVRLLADEYAENGYYVYVPDFFQGDYVPVSLGKYIAPLKSDPEPSLLEKTTGTAQVAASLGPWLAKHRESVSRPLIEQAVRDVKKEAEKVGAVGFCWGGRYSILLAGKSSPVQVDASIANHPSFLSLPGEAEDVVKPVSVAVGEGDVMMGTDQSKQLKEILEKKGGKVEIYDEEACHGFSVRGDLNNEKEKKLKEKSLEQAIDWLGKHL